MSPSMEVELSVPSIEISFGEEESTGGGTGGPGTRPEPVGELRFLVEIAGVEIGWFSECTGLQAEHEVTEYLPGGAVSPVKLRGAIKYPNIVLKRGYTSATELWQWRKSVLNGQVDRRSGSITLLDEARNPALEWKFREGWPSKWEGPTLNAKNNEVAIETLEICHEGLELA